MWKLTGLGPVWVDPRRTPSTRSSVDTTEPPTSSGWSATIVFADASSFWPRLPATLAPTGELSEAQPTTRLNTRQPTVRISLVKRGSPHRHPDRRPTRRTRGSSGCCRRSPGLEPRWPDRSPRGRPWVSVAVADGTCQGGIAACCWRDNWPSTWRPVQETSPRVNPGNMRVVRLSRLSVHSPAVRSATAATNASTFTPTPTPPRRTRRTRSGSTSSHCKCPRTSTLDSRNVCNRPAGDRRQRLPADFPHAVAVRNPALVDGSRRTVQQPFRLVDACLTHTAP